MLETTLEQRRALEQLRETKQRTATLFLSLFLHGAVGTGLAMEPIKREIRARFNSAKVTDMVRDIQVANERGRKISEPGRFLQLADALRNGFSEEMVAESNRQIQLEVGIARKMVEAGQNEQRVADYLLSRQGEYASKQNSVVFMMSMPPEARTGNCNARFLRLASEFPHIYPEKYEQGLFSAQLFQGADTDNDGELDTPPHVRFVMDLQNGTHLVIEGKRSQVEKDLDPTQRPTTIELSQLLTTSFLADQGLYNHPQGVDTRSKGNDHRFKSFLQYPDSFVSYGPNPNPDVYAEPVPSTGWIGDSEAFAVNLLEEEENLPTISTVEEASTFPKDGVIQVASISSPEAARELLKGFSGELFVKHIPTPAVAQELVQKNGYNLTIQRIDSIQVAEALLTNPSPTRNIELRVLDSVEVAGVLAKDQNATIAYDVITPEVAEVLSRSESGWIQVRNLTPEIARRLASGTITNLDTEIIDTPELAQALKSGSLKSISIGIGDTWGSPLAALDSPTNDPQVARALVGGSVKLLIDRYEAPQEPAEAVEILKMNGISVWNQ